MSSKTWSRIVSLGYILILLSFLTLPLRSVLGWTWYVLISLGVVFVLFYFLKHPAALRQAILSRQTKFGTNTIVMVGSLLVVLSLVNLIAGLFNIRWDLSGTKQYTLSKQTVSLLKKVHHKVSILAFYRTGYGLATQTFLRQYQNQSPNISVQWLNPNQHPSLAQKYHVLTSGTVVVVSGSAHQTLPSAVVNEQTVTTAVVTVSGPPQTVYFLTGHGERSILDISRQGFNGLAKSLVKDGFSVQSLSLLSGGTIPKNASAIVIPDPTVPLLKHEIAILLHYVQHGGNLMVMSEPGQGKNVASLLSPFGMRISNRTLVDPVNNLRGQDPLTPSVNQYPFSVITSGLPATYFPTAAAVIHKPATGQIIEHGIIKTSTHAFLSAQGKVKNSKAKKQAYALASIMDSGHGRMLVFGDTDFASNAYNTLGNRSLMIRALDWLTRPSEIKGLPTSSPLTTQVFLSPPQMQLVFNTTVLFLPLAMLAAGGVMWWLRR